MLEGTGSTSADLTGNGHTLSVSSGASWTTISGEAAIAYDGSANQPSAITSPFDFDGSTDWSVAWRGKQTSSGVDGILAGDNTTSPDFIFFNGGTALRFRNSSSVTADFSPTVFTTDANYVLAYDASGTRVHLYKDGSEVSGSPITSITGSFQLNTLGNGQTGTAFNLVGSLTYFYVWSGRELTSSDASALHTDPYQMLDAPAPETSVTISAPSGVMYRQRNGSSQYSTTLSGTFESETANEPLEWNFAGGSYTALTSEGSNAFSETINVPAGSGVIRVRFVGDTDTFDESDAITVGDVFLVAGQSNAEGRADNAQSHSGTYTLACYRQDNAWRLNNSDPTDTGTSNGSIWPRLSRHIEADQSVPVMFITTGAGGTGLVDPAHWDPSATPNNYSAMLTSVTNSGVNSVKAILWYQGETDSINDVSETDYYNTLKEFADEAAGDVAGAPKTCALQLGFEGGTINSIRTAIRRNWDDGGNVFGGPCMYDKSNSVHPSSDALIQTQADRYFAALKEQLYGGSAGVGRGPRIQSATFSSTTVVKVRFDKVLKTGLTFGTGAWKVVDGGGAKTVSSVAYHSTDNQAVDVTVSTACSGATTISLGDDNDAVSVVVPLGPDFSLPGGAGTINLPAEPFISYSVTAPAGAARYFYEMMNQ